VREFKMKNEKRQNGKNFLLLDSHFLSLLFQKPQNSEVSVRRGSFWRRGAAHSFKKRGKSSPLEFQFMKIESARMALTVVPFGPKRNLQNFIPSQFFFVEKEFRVNLH